MGANLSTFETVIVTFQIIITLVVVSGSSLVLYAFGKFNHLQTPSGKFIANLSASDLCLGLSLPFQISFFYHPWLSFTKEACLLRFEVIIFTSTSSLISLLFTVFDRHIAVYNPLRYPSLMCDRTANVMIGIVWIYAMGLAIPPLLGYNTFDEAPICAYELVMAKPYRMLVALHFICLPVIMFIIYCRIFYTAWSHKRAISSQHTGIMYNNNTSIQRETKTAVVMAIVMLFFTLCWLPFSFIQLLQAVEFSVDKAVISNFLVFIGLMNSIMNPFIYVWKNKQYKEAFRKILCFPQNPNRVSDLQIASISLEVWPCKISYFEAQWCHLVWEKIFWNGNTN